MHRRSIIRLGGAALAGATPLLASRAALAADPIVVGAIHDLSGGLEIYGKTMADALTLAIEEQNSAGGLLGRQLSAKVFDPQSNMQLYAQFAQQAALRDKSAVVIGGITSASREVIRPVMSRTKTLYLYNTFYEGGVCDRNTFCTGMTPGQSVARLVPYAMSKWGKKVYVVAADYNYGQITSNWIRKFVQDGGGSIVGTEFFPLDVTNFGPTISKIEAARPDMVVSVLVGGAHISFYRQWAAAGMTRKIPMASTTFGSGNEHLVLSPAECDGFMVGYNYVPSIESAANTRFKQRFYKRFGNDYPNITELGVATYQGFQLWAAAVARAGSLDRTKVTEALESGLSVEGPSGKVTMDAATHHCTLDVTIAEIRNKEIKVLQTFAQQPPSDTGAVCNLRKNPLDNQQYMIKI